MKARLKCTPTVQGGKERVSRFYVEIKGASRYTYNKPGFKERKYQSEQLETLRLNIFYRIILASAKCMHKT